MPKKDNQKKDLESVLANLWDRSPSEKQEILKEGLKVLEAKLQALLKKAPPDAKQRYKDVQRQLRINKFRFRKQEWLLELCNELQSKYTSFSFRMNTQEYKMTFPNYAANLPDPAIACPTIGDTIITLLDSIPRGEVHVASKKDGLVIYPIRFETLWDYIQKEDCF
jgi:hypothetical protein